MGRAPCCDKANVKKGPWSPEEDSKLKDYIEKFGTGGNWIALPQKAGLKRCGKSCRLRWLNYLRPNIKHGEFSDEEDRIICTLFASIGSRWSIIAAQLPGRTDNDIKNYWNTKLKKKLMAISPNHKKTLPFQSPPLIQSSHHQSLLSLYNNNNNKDSSFTSNFPFYPISKPSFGPIIPSSNTINYQNQEISLPLQLQYYCNRPTKENNNNNSSNLLVFGSEASCSSNNSEGSCSQISYGTGGRGEIKQEEIGFQSLNIPHGYEENQKFMLSYNNNNNGSENLNQWWAEKGNNNGYFGEMTSTVNVITANNNPLDYDLEEVKQLISSGSNYNNLFIDENKTQDNKFMFYY